jgi:hypothetical protein
VMLLNSSLVPNACEAASASSGPATSCGPVGHAITSKGPHGLGDEVRGQMIVCTGSFLFLSPCASSMLELEFGPQRLRSRLGELRSRNELRTCGSRNNEKTFLATILTSKGPHGLGDEVRGQMIVCTGSFLFLSPSPTPAKPPRRAQVPQRAADLWVTQ